MAKRKYRILVTNDDGVHADGIKALGTELAKHHDVYVFAPLEEKSFTGHSLTINSPLRVYNIKDKWFGVNGGPADCINVALNRLLKFTPDFVVSGINRGANMGQDIFCSGTVSGAREACFFKIPSISVSLAHEKNQKGKLNYDSAAKVITNILKVLGPKDIPEFSYLNVNVPDIAYSKLKGVHVSNQGFQIYSKDVTERTDMRGRKYYWIGGIYKGFKNLKGTDCHTVYSQKSVSLTMLRIFTEDHEANKLLRQKTIVL